MGVCVHPPWKWVGYGSKEAVLDIDLYSYYYKNGAGIDGVLIFPRGSKREDGAMKSKFRLVVVLFLLAGLLGVAAGPADCAVEARRISDLDGGKVMAMAPLNGGLWLGVDNGSHGEVWFSDGTSAGTVHVEDLAEMASPDHWVNFVVLDEVGNSVIFDYQGLYGELGYDVEHYMGISDGTAEGTAIFTSGEDEFFFLTTGKLGNVACFYVSDSASETEDFWRSDGTVAGTYVLKAGIEARGGCELDDVLYFSGSSSLWRTDGTVEGTYTLQPGGGACISNTIVAMGGAVYFKGASAGGETNRLLRSDGTVEGTYGLQPDGETCGNDLFVKNDVLYFCGETSSGTAGLFRSDGTVPGTYLVEEISSAESFEENVLLGDTAVFSVDSSTGDSLWSSDGTSHGTVLLMEGYAGALTVSGDAVYFLANTGTGDLDLWKTDGSPAGTSLVYEIGAPVSTFVSFVCGLEAVNGQLLCWFQDFESDVHLFVSDGSPAGTVAVDTAELNGAGAGLEGIAARYGIYSAWSQNGFINLRCWDFIGLLGRLNGTQVEMVQLHDSLLGVTDDASAWGRSYPVLLGENLCFCGYNGGLWATPTSFRFTRHPSAGWRQVGDPLALSFGYVGDVGPVTCQWHKDGEAIEGATNAEFYIASLIEDDEGWYSCRVTDSTKELHETNPVFVKVWPEGSLPAAGTAGLGALVAACIVAAVGVFRKKT